MELKQIKLKRHETFSIREGWLQKVINNFNDTSEYGKKCFSKDLGQKILGIGTNMVKSLRYWSEACCIIDFDAKKGNELSELGNVLSLNDPYLSNITSWWLIHLYLCSNNELAPVFNTFFNLDINHFEKEQIFKYIKSYLEKVYEITSESSLDSDINILIKSYYSEDFSNPEDNMSCPLSKLGLIKFNGRYYEKIHPKYDSLNYKIIYLCILNCCNKKQFNIEDLFNLKNNPLCIFNLSKSGLFQYLDEIKNHGYIELVKTAGLNTVTIIKTISLNDIF